MITVVFFLVVIWLIIYFIFSDKFNHWKKHQVQHPKPNVIFGNFGKIIFLRETITDFCSDIYNKYRKASFVGFYKMWTPAVILRDINLIYQILIKDFNHFQDRYRTVEEYVDPILSKNPICLKGSYWKTVRSQLNPQFTLSKLKSTLPILQEVSNNMLFFIDRQIKLNNICLNAYELSRRFTSESVFMCGFGLEGNSFSDKVPIAFQIGEEICGTELILKIKHLIGFYFPFLARLFKITFIGRPVPEEFRKIIVNLWKYRKLHNEIRYDFLDYIANIESANNTVDEDALVGHAFTYYLDGFETTGNPITFMMYELALNQSIQERCRSEIRSVLGNYKSSFTGETFSQLKYIDSVILETLRKHTPVTVLTRVCTKEYVIPSVFTPEHNKNVIIPQGTIVVIPSKAIHSDPLHYPNPEEFNPDRFQYPHSKKKAFLVFGDGRRMCLGKNFALLQMKVFLVTILGKYQMTLNKKTVLPYKLAYLQILTVPNSKIYIDFTALKSKFLKDSI